MIAFGIASFSTAICLKTNPDPKVWARPNDGIAQCQAVLWIFCIFEKPSIIYNGKKTRFFKDTELGSMLLIRKNNFRLYFNIIFLVITQYVFKIELVMKINL